MNRTSHHPEPSKREGTPSGKAFVAESTRAWSTGYGLLGPPGPGALGRCCCRAPEASTELFTPEMSTCLRTKVGQSPRR